MPWSIPPDWPRNSRRDGECFSTACFLRAGENAPGPKRQNSERGIYVSHVYHPDFAWVGSAPERACAQSAKEIPAVRRKLVRLRPEFLRPRGSVPRRVHSSAADSWHTSELLTIRRWGDFSPRPGRGRHPLFCLPADVVIRQRTGDKKGLEHALRGESSKPAARSRLNGN